MKLYKTVDIEDLKSILKKGILPISVTGKEWEGGWRANNSKEVVYLYQPIKPKTPVQYGLVLLEVETEAQENKMEECDGNIVIYKEFITSKVLPEEIKKIYLPKFLKDRFLKEYPFLKELKIEWVECVVKWYDFSIEVDKLEESDDMSMSELEKIWKENWRRTEKACYVDMDSKTLAQFVKTASLSLEQGGFFRGTREDRTTIDIKDIEYRLED